MRTSGFWVSVMLASASLLLGCSAEQRAERRAKTGDNYYEKGRYEEAEIEYLNVVKINPKNAKAVARLGLIYQEQGREAQAYHFLSTSRELDPENLEVRVRLGFLYLAANERKKAREEAEFVLERQPANRHATVLLAEATDLPEGLESAWVKLAELRGKGGDPVGLHLATGTLHFGSGDYTSAESEWKKASDIDPRSSEAHHALGNLFWMRNDLVAAERHLKKAADLSPVRSIRRVKYADFKVSVGEIDAAVGELQKITEQAADYLPALIRQAEVALMQTNHSRCDAILRQVLTRDPYSFQGHLLRGRLSMEKNEAQAAVSAFEAMVQLFPKSPVAHCQLGIAHRRNNDSRKAVSSVRDALALAPDYQPAGELLVQLCLEQANTAEAIQTAGALLKRNPRSAQANLLMADTLQAAGKTAEAVNVLRNAAEMDPHNPQPFFRLGMISLAAGDRDAALKRFEEALVGERVFMPALENLIDLHLAGGRIEEAEQRLAQDFPTGSKPAEFHYLSAKIALARGQAREAEVLLNQALELNKSLAPAHLLKAQLQLDNGKHQEGVGTLQVLLKLEPANLAALALLATVHTSKEQFQDAARVYERWLEVEPRSVVALNNLAWIYSEKLNRLGEAATFAQRALNVAPEHPEVKHTLGWIRCQQEDYATGLELLEQAASSLTNHLELVYHLGVAQHMMGHEAAARATFQDVLFRASDDETREQVRRWLQVHEFDPRGDEAGIRSTIEEWVEQQPSDSLALLKLGAYYEHRREGRKAVSRYEAVIRRRGRHPAALLGLSRVYENLLNDSTNALIFARRAYEAGPEDPIIIAHLGRLCGKAHDYKLAISLLEKTATKRALSVEEASDLASAYFAVGRLPQAEAALSLALQSTNLVENRRGMETLLRFTRFILNGESKQEDVRLAEAVLQTNKTSLPALAVIATALERKGAVEEARAHFARLLDRFPAFAPAKKRLAILHTRTPANWEKAYEWAQKARLEYPDDSDIAKLLTIRYYRRTSSSNTNAQAQLDELLKSLR